MTAPTPMRYRDSGVSIDAGNELVERIKRVAARTHGPQVLAGLGGFGALYELPVERYLRPVLVSATDGVGTKAKLAAQWARHDDIGVDLVAMCVNDILACGAAPLYFLDYFATGELDVDVAESVVSGIARGCELANCALAGGETAEMPGMYARGDYDLAGFAVGIVEKARILDAAQVRVGDVALGLASSGAHANGYSLIRAVLARSGDGADQAIGGATLADALLAPTRIYVKSVLALLAEIEVSAACHITGGGLIENPPRVLPRDTALTIHRSAWTRPALFDYLARSGDIDDAEMVRTFNCGIGMIIIVRAADARAAGALLCAHGETVFELGEVVAADGAPQVRMLD